MSPTELMIMAAQKLMKGGSIDKWIIDQSITFLHRLVLECKIDNEVSPSDKLKTITEHILKDFQSLWHILN